MEFRNLDEIVLECLKRFLLIKHCYTNANLLIMYRMLITYKLVINMVLRISASYDVA